MIRNQPITEEIWSEVSKYKVVGDWYLYLCFAQGGRIAYRQEAIAYFRQHGENTSVKSFKRESYYAEHEQIALALRKHWGTTPDVVLRCFQNLYQQYLFSQSASFLAPIHKLFSTDKVLSTPRSRYHVLMSFLGFHLGGGELFPIHLANSLVRSGIIVSALVLDTNSENGAIRKLLDPRVAVYESQLVKEMGIDQFIKEAGVDLIHSHYVGIEFFFFWNTQAEVAVPIVVTLHGSYESTFVPDILLLQLLRKVSVWTYLTPSNLNHLSNIPLAKDRLVHIPNGMPKPSTALDFSRDDLNLEKTDFVFTIASRAIKDKGWDIAIQAFKAICPKTKLKLKLLLIGDGPERARLEAEHGADLGIRFLGFQSNVNSFLQVSDVLLLPTRFKGESYPLVLIQAMQCGVPIIATDVGHISDMLQSGAFRAGRLIDFDENDERFGHALAVEMLNMAVDLHLEEFQKGSQQLGKAYDIESVAEKYARLYETCLTSY